MQIRERGVAFFDSGIGGLTVMAACRKYLPNEPFYYYGDNENAPYGNLTPEQIKGYLFQAFDVFVKLNVKAAVVACNTATAVCVDELRQKYSFPIVGVEPAVFAAARKRNDVLVLSTSATHNSARFHDLCLRVKRRFPEVKIQSVACPSLAGVIEKGIVQSGIDYTQYLPTASPCAVVLGCTHYIYIKEVIRDFYGCEVYDGNEGVARRLCLLLEKNRDGQPLLPQRPQIEKGTNLVNETAPNFFLGASKTYNQHVYEQMFAKNKV